jgi:NAD(P)-dependent dehydrogenase (short-subunit alcohol dehydrogenase family)
MLSHIVSLVSGGASGLGAATAACLVRHGARVVVADLQHQKEQFLRFAMTPCADAAVSNNEQEGIKLIFAEMDVLNEAQINKALDLAEVEFGEPGETSSIVSQNVCSCTTSIGNAKTFTDSVCTCKIH